MKPVQWVGGLLAIGLIALGLWVGWQKGWFGGRGMGVPAEPKYEPPPQQPTPAVETFFDPKSYLWLQHPAGGSVVPGDRPPVEQTPPELAAIADRPLWRVLTGPSDGSAASGSGPASSGNPPAGTPPVVIVWQLKRQPEGDAEALGQRLVHAIEAAHGAATPLADAVVNSAGLGGIRINYALSVTGPDSRAILLRFALLRLDESAYLVWFSGPPQARPAIDEIVASARFRRQKG